MKIRVIVADDHHCVRQGLVVLLERESDMEVVAEARDGMELVRLAREFEPDVPRATRPVLARLLIGNLLIGKFPSRIQPLTDGQPHMRCVT